MDAGTSTEAQREFTCAASNLAIVTSRLRLAEHFGFG